MQHHNFLVPTLDCSDLMDRSRESLLLSACLGFVAGGAIVYQLLSRRKGRDSATVVEEAILARRTVQTAYFDSTTKVPREYIDRMLEAANWAPTHGKTEPWRFVVFEDETARKALGEKDAEIYKAITKLEAFSERKYNKKINSKLQASYVIAIGMKRQESKKIPLVEEQMAVACAVQNMHILGSALGLGCCWLSGPTVNTTEMKEYLKFYGPDDECLGFFCVGMPDPGKKAPKMQRKPIEEKVRRI